MSKKKICVVTGSRAEYGLLHLLMKRIQRSSRLELQVIASAMHLSPEFGLTYRQIENDGFTIDEKIEMLLSGDTSVAITKSMGLGTIGFAEAYHRLQPDLVVLLGDRFETLSAAQAAMIAKIPVAHIHGGEITEGSVDESIRHAITKMSHLHFVATDEFRRRVLQLGENPAHVFVSGAPGIDNIKQMKLMDRQSFEQAIQFSLAAQNFMVTYHPVTLSDTPASNSLENLMTALDHYPRVKLIVTFPNADAQGRQLIQQIKDYAAKHEERVYVTSSLGQQLYLSALQFVDLVIGNSSSGLLEVPSFGIPTVNIGDRQKGRMRADSIIDCGESSEAIIGAIETALSEEFRAKAALSQNPYGQGNAAQCIADTIARVDFSSLHRKPFFDLEFSL